jgi:hypothetical protein
MAGYSWGKFSIRKNKPLPRDPYSFNLCEIVAEEKLPGSEDTVIRAKRANYECIVIWDEARQMLRSPWSHDDDRCEVIAWGRTPDDIASVGNWTTKETTIWRRKAEAIAAYGGTPVPARNKRKPLKESTAKHEHEEERHEEEE